MAKRINRSPVASRQAGSRVARMSNEVHKVLADALERRFDSDGGSIATITAVLVDPDMRRARIYFDHLDAGLMKWLSSNRHHLQRDIATQIRMRCTPLLEFFSDPTIESGIKIESILRQLAVNTSEDNHIGS